ncbi:MAG: hypothetical protein EOO27_16945 [Comamonadaceae bacterium]|jgi:hypothetical protein|nr:MAG: hypothetical protein EOO27_16945 [Comamonadaceae bacterium]
MSAQYPNYPGPQPHYLYYGAPSTRGSARLLPYLIAAVASSLGIIIGSIGPWATFFAFSSSGTEGDGVVTLILGTIAAIALFTLMGMGGRARFGLQWVAPVVGLLSLIVAVADIINVTSTSGELFGETVGAQIGWGLWLVAASSVALCIMSIVVAVLARKRLPPRPPSWPPYTAPYPWNG